MSRRARASGPGVKLVGAPRTELCLRSRGGEDAASCSAPLPLPLNFRSRALPAIVPLPTLTRHPSAALFSKRVLLALSVTRKASSRMLLRAALSACTRSAPRPLKPLGAVRCASHGPVGYGSGAYRGLKIPKVAAFHQNVATVMGTILWLWIFYRAKNDGPALLVRAHSPKPAHSPSPRQPRARPSRARALPREGWRVIVTAPPASAHPPRAA